MLVAGVEPLGRAPRLGVVRAQRRNWLAHPVVEDEPGMPRDFRLQLTQLLRRGLRRPPWCCLPSSLLARVRPGVGEEPDPPQQGEWQPRGEAAPHLRSEVNNSQ